MNAVLQELSDTLLSKNWKDLQPAALQALAHEHPACASIQLLLSQKLKQLNEDGYETQWQKTLLYFNNPLFIHYLFKTPQTTGSTATTSASLLPVKEEGTSCPLPEEEIPLPALKIEPIDPATAQLAFTPYYTIDYFASQGIKLKEEQKSKDAFGKQLKSFTQWLKEMRRLPEAQVSAKLNALDAVKVAQMAQQSLTGENAVTEAMAQVWLKQQFPAKAIEVYKKLSLQNPSKSAYFAAKIEHLKKLL